MEMQESLEIEQEGAKILRVYISRNEEEGTWEVEFENGLNIPYVLRRLSDVDKAIDVAKKVHEEMTGQKLNILRFINMTPDYFGQTQF